MAIYDGMRWKRKRLEALRRDRYPCQYCKRYGKLTPADEVHHILTIDEAPEKAYDLDNLVSLCRACHNKLHGIKGAKGYRKMRT